VEAGAARQAAVRCAEMALEQSEYGVSVPGLHTREKVPANYLKFGHPHSKKLLPAPVLGQKYVKNIA
jgi:hypothetical protein